MAEGVPARLTRGESRRFGLTVGAAFVVLGGLLWWRGRVTAAEIVAGVGGLFVLAGMILPGALPPVHRAWMAAALAMSKVTTPILLGIVYFAVLTPIALARRVFGSSPIGAKGLGGSTWVERRAQRGSPADMEHQF
jgi:hypothetical protein